MRRSEPLTPSLKVLPLGVGDVMASQLPKEETVTIEEVVISQSYEIAALVTILERKGILSIEEIIGAIKELKTQSNA